MERVAARVATPPSLAFKGSNMAALAMLIKDDPPGTGGTGGWGGGASEVVHLLADRVWVQSGSKVSQQRGS